MGTRQITTALLHLRHRGGKFKSRRILRTLGTQRAAVLPALRGRRRLPVTRDASTLPQFVRDLLASPPHRGEGLNLWFYRTARVLHPYRDSAEIINLLYAATAGEAVKRGEIERAVERSKATAWQPGQLRCGAAFSAWPKVNQEQREAITATGFGLVDLWEISPIRFEDSAAHTEQIIDVLFPGNPWLCVGASNSNFKTRRREELRGELASLALIVPSPMTAQRGHTQEGKESEHSLENTGPRRFLVIEQDRGSIDEQSAILYHLAQRAPLVIAVHSGSKSLHGWFCSAGVAQEKVARFFRYAVALGADRALETRNQFARMPDGLRDNGNRQTVYFFNPEVIR
jgi:hypothetical protein